MKRFLYNNYTKFVAFILCALSAAIASYMFTTNFLKTDHIYFFESSYQDSREAGNALSRELERVTDAIASTIDGSGKLHAEKLNMPSPKEWEYYIKIDGSTYTNAENASYQSFENSELSIGIMCKTYTPADQRRAGFVKAFGGGYFFPAVLEDSAKEYEICVKMGDETIAENAAKWDDVKRQADDAVAGILALMALATVFGIYLLCATGRKYGEEKIRLMLIDRAFVEFTLALAVLPVIGGVFAGWGLYYLIAEEEMAFAHTLAAAAIFAVVAIEMLCLLSLVRNLKNSTFLERSLIVRVCKWAWRTAKKILAWAWETVIKILRGIKWLFTQVKKNILTVSAKNFDGRFVGIMITGFALVIFILSKVMRYPISMAGFVLVAFVVAAVIFVNKRLIGFANLKNGIEKIKNGDLDYKIEGCPDGVIGQMAENVNSIGDGLQKSLASEIKAERMKSELITNVSHDLKTPLTSIINYADLLSQERLTPAEANDYVKIIKQKGERLKQLTNDLFDISKAQSGNEEFILEDIDLCLLINQAMAELNERIEKSGLVFKLSASDKEIFVRADGKKMSRVFENLLNNCVKYSMANTRVYIDIVKTNGGAEVQIKNIAGYEMNFDEAEITERFVRGDSSRSTEGSGLGLAIVKSYVEGCGGSVEIKKDGDLFKVILKL